MSEFPSLAAFLAQHRFDDSMDEEIFCHESDGSPMVGMKRGPNPQADWQEWVDHIADAWREACTIRTVEQLDALPDDSIVRGAHGMPWHKDCYGWWPASASAGARAARLISLPALLIWHPDWART